MSDKELRHRFSAITSLVFGVGSVLHASIIAEHHPGTALVAIVGGTALFVWFYAEDRAADREEARHD